MDPTPTTSARATRVFGISDLFEIVLSYLCADDILAATQIKRRSFDILRSSSALPKRTMQLVRRNGRFFHPWSRIPEGDVTRFTMPGMRISIDLSIQNTQGM